MESKYFTAGEIAKLTGVSVRTIRFYDSKGILKPSDYSESGYRLYDENSVKQLQKILMLKYLGLSLEQIELTLKADEHRDARMNLKETLSQQQELLKEKKKHLERLIHAVDVAIEANEDTIWDKLIDIMRITTYKEMWLKHKNEDNLQSRIHIHAYSTAEIPWTQWVYERIGIKEGMRVLEIGCGNGYLWESVRGELPEHLELYLTDFSEGMLENAKTKLSEYQNEYEKKHIHFTFKVEDADDFQLEEEKFDVIVANHMLYHVKNREDLFKKVKSLLKQDGTFYCSTVGQKHMYELHQMLENCYPNIDIPLKSIMQNFSLENGKEQLEKVFDDVKLDVHENDLIIDQTDVIYDYVHSYPGNAVTILEQDGERFRDVLDEWL